MPIANALPVEPSIAGVAKEVAVVALGARSRVVPGARNRRRSTDPDDEAEDGPDPFEETRQALLNRPAPNFEMTDVQTHARISTRRMRGKIVIVHMFARWVQYCQRSLPALQQIAARHPKSVAVVAVGSYEEDESDAEVAAYAASFGVHYGVVRSGQDEKVFKDFKVPALPISYVIDAKGVVRNIIRGWRDDYTQTVEDAITQLQPADR